MRLENELLFRPFKIQVINTKLIQINNRFLEIIFSKTGTVLNIQHKTSDEKIRFHSNIIHYGTSKQSDHHSGAYLFLPNGDGQDIPMSKYDFIRIQRGPLVSRVDLIHEIYGLQYKLTNTNG
jgi:alpha-mannosidase II